MYSALCYMSWKHRFYILSTKINYSAPKWTFRENQKEMSRQGKFENQKIFVIMEIKQDKLQTIDLKL